MRTFVHRVFLLAIGLLIGYALAHKGGEVKSANRVTPVSCYDSQGKSIPDPFAKFGGVRTACAPGQVATLAH